MENVFLGGRGKVGNFMIGQEDLERTSKVRKKAREF